MPAAIQIGVPTNYRTPGNFIQINFGVGPGGADAGQYAILIIANKNSAGTATADTIVYGPTSTPQLQNETDVISLAGTGSEGHRVWLRVRRVLDIATTVGVTPPPVYMVFPTESAGTQATLTFTFANASTGVATFRFYCGDEFVDTPVTNAQTIASLGAAVAQSINNQTRWPITASFTTATLTITAKNFGPRGNEIRLSARIIGGTTATTVTNNVSTPMAGGATADSWTTALATILPSRYYYIVSPSSDVSGTTFDDLITQVLAQAQPLVGIRQVVVSGFVGTQAAGSTVAANSAINTERAQLAWLQTSELTAGEIAGHVAAVRAVFESLDWSHNFRDFGLGEINGIPTQKFWRLGAPMTQANWPTPTSIETALNNGLTPIGVTSDGRTYITRSQTTRHKNGSNFDYRAADTSIPAVIDRWADELGAEFGKRFGGRTIIDDVRDGEPTPGENTVQPKQIKALVFEKLDKYANVYLKKVADIKAGVVVQRDPDNQQRVGVRIPIRVIDLFLQGAIEIDDNSTAV